MRPLWHVLEAASTGSHPLARQVGTDGAFRVFSCGPDEQPGTDDDILAEGG